MVKVGIVGLGFMGSMHYRCWSSTAGAKLVAVCDTDEAKLSGQAGTAGNIEGAADALDLSAVAKYTDLKKMLAETELDALSVTLPTYLHAEATVQGLAAGVNVLCEKPMASTSEQCGEMIAAARKAGKILQVGQCIRFWPEYAKLKEIIEGGEYGAVKAATFQRLSATPQWSWQGWILDPAKGGGAAHDLHIHDADFVQYVFGMPQAVFSRMAKGPAGGLDHAVTQYVYDNGAAVSAEGGWLMTDGFGFRMSFHVVLEKASVVFDITREPAFQVCPAQGAPFSPKVAGGDGYSREIEHFAKLVGGEKTPEILTPESSMNSVKLIEAEKKSAQTGKLVSL